MGRSARTRYQDFKRVATTRPDFGADDEARKLYRETLDFLFAEYEGLSAHMTQTPDQHHPEALPR